MEEQDGVPDLRLLNSATVKENLQKLKGATIFK